MLSISPLLAWFFALILVLLAGRATARLASSRLASARGSAATRPLSPTQRDSELAHAAMGLGMAALIAPGIPRPPQAVSVCFFAGLAALAAFDWARRVWNARHGRAGTASCAASGERTHLLDPHHAIVGVAMIVMLLRPSAGGTGTAVAMPGMVMGAAAGPSPTVLFFLAYVWIAALVLGYGMTRVLPGSATGTGTGTATATGTGTGTGTGTALLSSPATVYACELAMTVLTGLMLLN